MPEDSEIDQLRQLQSFLAGRQTEIHRERAFLNAEEQIILLKRQELHERIGEIVIRNQASGHPQPELPAT